MPGNAAKRENVLVSAASISADLHEVSRIAKHISIGVKNAKAVAARAGDQARGFQPITDFINEMAMDIMGLVKHIDRAALNVTKMAAMHSHTLDTLSRIEKSRIESEGLKYAAVIPQVAETVREDLEKQRSKLRAHARELQHLLDDIERRVRAAQVISNTSRVEAARAKEYRANLEAVAENLEQETNAIKERVIRCQKRLANVITDLRVKKL